MALILLTSAAGAPGVTSTALALTQNWRQDIALIDADYRQSILAGYLRGEHPLHESLMNVVNASRVSPDLNEILLAQLVALPGMDQTSQRRLLLPGLATPAMQNPLTSAWPIIAPQVAQLAGNGLDVLIDLGRLTPAGIPAALWEAADLVLVMVDPVLVHVGASRWGVELLHEQAAGFDGAATVQLVLLHARHHDHPDQDRWWHRRPVPTRYTAREVSKWLSNAPVAGEVSWDPENARTFSHGIAPGKRFTRSRLMNSTRALAAKLHQQLHRPDQAPDLSPLQLAGDLDA